MRIHPINLNGKTYLVTFSARVMLALEERGDDAGTELDRILTEGKLSDMFWLLSQMLDAGRRYAMSEELGDIPDPISLDQLLDTTDLADYQSLSAQVAQVIKADSTPSVESISAKNAEATPGV